MLEGKTEQTLAYSGLSEVALKLPGENILPSPIEVVSFTCCHFPSRKNCQVSEIDRKNSITGSVIQTFIKQEELMCSWDVLEGKNISGSRPENPHGCSHLLGSSHSSELVTRPYSKDCANCEVCVHNAGTIKWIKCNTEPSCSNSTELLRI